MQDTINNVVQVIGIYVPNVIGALLILIIGWLLAVGIAALIRTGLRRTNLDNRIARSLAGTDSAARIKSEEWISRAVFWLIMLFVIVAFLQALNLTIVTTPLNTLLNQLLSFLPNLFGAALLLLVAWLLATILRLVVSRGLKAIDFDRRVGAELEAQNQPPTGVYSVPEHNPGVTTPAPTASPASPALQRPLSDTLANAVYWLVFLLFLPAILDALALEGLLQPVNQLVNEVLAFLPNLFAAAIILLVGWFVARIVQRIVTNLSAAVGVDALSARVGLSSVLGQQRLSGLLGLIVYILILIPVVIAALNALQIEAITAPASNMLNAILNAIPDIFAAALILIIAYVVGRVVSGLVANLLTGIGFNAWLGRANISAVPAAGGATTPADFVGYLVLVGIMLVASIAALNLLGFTLLAELISDFTVLLGRILLGLIIFAIGLFLANLAARAIVTSNIAQRGLLAFAARISIIILAGAMALRQMGLANEIVNLAFGLLLGAVAVACALAFGLGGREAAGREVERWFEALRTRRFLTEPTVASEPRSELPRPRPATDTSPEAGA